MKIFVSYSHRQSDWVADSLAPVLRAGGADVLVDHERFRAGPGVIGQMDALQDRADRHLLVITKDYLSSASCRHEMNRAIALDPNFSGGTVLPVRRDGTPLPDVMTGLNPPLYVSLRDDTDVVAWRLLLGGCNAVLGTEAPAWLTAIKEAGNYLGRGQSVNLVVRGDIDWRAWLKHLKTRHVPRMGIVDLDDPITAPRHGLIEAVLDVLGLSATVPHEPDDLLVLGKSLESGGRSILGLTNIHRIADRPHYGPDLFSALRHLVMEKRHLVLFVQTRQPVASLLPPANAISKINFKTVNL